MKNNKTFAIIGMFVLVLIASFAFSVSAHSSSDFATAENIIQQKIPCSQLNKTQLIEIGDYYMQQMTGSSHESIDAMMGGDNSYADQQMHIAIAENYYCNGDGTINGSYGGMMGGGYGMMGGYPENYAGVYSNQGMMYGYGYGTFTYYLPWILLVLVIISATIIVLIVMSKKNKKRRR